MLDRILTVKEAAEDSVFLWGARQTGKSTLLRALFPNARLYDLLNTDVRLKLQMRPSLLREECSMLADGDLVIIDEVQKVPELLDEVHWLIENKGLRFILSGSSARKLRRSSVNMLGGRALRCVLFPLVSAEIPDFNVEKALNNGMLPRHYLIDNPVKRIKAYLSDYLQQEIVEEAIVRRLDSFTRFLQVAAISNTEIVNFTKIAQDCGISSKTVKEYFVILEETMLGFFLHAYTKVVKRRVISSPKFYYFDVAIANHLLNRYPIQKGTDIYGHSLEHLVIQELRSYIVYRDLDKRLTYWHTLDNKYEVDAVIGDAEIAIEVKSSDKISIHDARGLKVFSTEYPQAHLIIVAMENIPRMMGNVEVWPVEQFFKQLWEDRWFKILS